MRERPIIMGAESVRAILEGRKTQTRRVVKHIPALGLVDDWYHRIDNADFKHIVGDYRRFCPYGKVGDRLWVRETWKPGAWRSDGRVAIDYQASPELTHTPWIFTGNKIKQFIFRWLEEVIESGLEPNSEGRYEWEAGMSPLKWKSPIFMPRWASRITLEITDIRVERVQDISAKDAIAEGIPAPYVSRDEYEPISMYRELWQKLNAKRGYPWEKNLWVWVVTFKQVL